MNILERPQACGCPTSECDGLTCGSVVRTAAQDHSVVNHYTVEQASGDCTEVQAAPKVHHSNKSGGPGHGCTPSGRHPNRRKPVADERQHGYPMSTVEDRYLSVVAQPQSEDVEGISPHVLEEGIPQGSLVEGSGLQQSVGTSSQEETETLNVLVNDGSSVGAYTLDLIVPPKLTSEITQLPTLEPIGSCVICVVTKSSRSVYSSQRTSK